MTTFNILKKTPTCKSIIHTGMTDESARDFLKTMSEGGYDHSGTPGDFCPRTMTAYMYDNGDLIQYFADPEN